MIEFFAGVLALGFGFGLSLLICSSKLNKSNNLGDSRGNSQTYHAEAKFTSTCDNMDRSAADAFFNLNAVKRSAPDEKTMNAPVRRLTDEEREKKAVEDKKARVPKGAFVSKNTSGYGAQSFAAEEWEKRADRNW